MAYFHCLIGGGSSGGGYELTVTCDADFASSTITCTDGVTTLTQTCPSSSPYEVVFEIPNGGDWTISGVYQGDTISTQISIPDEISLDIDHTPDGSTVTPTDDIQIWLACAEITGKSYTTLVEVLADTDTYQLLLANSNAANYMARSTTWASGVCADSTAMKLLGKYDYVCDKLINDSTWLSAIKSSSYFDSVLLGLVPRMTSNTTPSGTASASSSYNSTFDAWKAFDGTNTGGTASGSTDCWASDGANSFPKYIQYEFEDPVNVALIKYKTRNTNTATDINSPKEVVIQGSNNGTNWTNIGSNTSTVATSNTEVSINSNSYSSYKYIRFVVNSINKTTSGTGNTDYYVCVGQLQFYGRHESSYVSGKVAIHGARNASIYYKDGGSDVSVGTTDIDTGIASVNISDMPLGTYALYDGVAKDPSDLTADYSKTVTITSNTTDVWLMPDNTYYWWGYQSDDLYELSGANGYAYSTGSFAAPTYNTNNILCNGNAASRASGVGTIVKLPTGTICNSIQTAKTLTGNVGSYLTAKEAMQMADAQAVVAMDTTTVADQIELLSITLTKDCYVWCDAHHYREGYIHAFWIE